MKKRTAFLGLLVASLVASPGLWSRTNQDKDRAELAKAVAKAEAITSGADLTAAKAQSEAMAKAKQSLRAALAKVLKGNPGFRAVSVFPSLKDGHPMAEVTLARGDEWKTVSEKLE